MVSTKEFLGLNAGQAQAILNKSTIQELVEFLTLLMDGETPDTNLASLPRHNLIKRIWKIYKEESPKQTSVRVASNQNGQESSDSALAPVHKGIFPVPSETDKLFLRMIVEGLSNSDGDFAWYTKVHSSLDTQYDDSTIDTELDSLASKGWIRIDNSKITITEPGAAVIKECGILESSKQKSPKSNAVNSVANTAPRSAPAATPPRKPAHTGATGIIHLRTTVNPKKAGTAAFKRFELYEDGLTVSQALEKGVTKEDIRWDSSRGYIEVTSAEEAS